MHTPYTRFIILSDARTGSNLLQDALNAHPAIICYRELFNLDPEFVDFDAEGRDGRDPATLALRGTDPAAFLDRDVFTTYPRPLAAVGFKFHYGHFWFHADLLPALVADSALHVIHLQRQNMLRSLVSARIAEQTGEWLRHDAVRKRRNVLLSRLTRQNLAAAARDPAAAVRRLRAFLRPVNAVPAATRTAVTLSREECERHFFRVRHEVQHFGREFAAHPTLALTYEDLVAARDDALARVERFLGAEPQPASTTLRRQNPEPLSELIANYDDLRRQFAGTEFAPFFDE